MTQGSVAAYFPVSSPRPFGTGGVSADDSTPPGWVMPATDATVGELPSSGPAPRWVVFSCEGHLFGVPVAQVREILRPATLTRIPGSGTEIAGLVNVRGRVVTVLDFGAALSLRPAVALPEYLLLVLEQEERPAALAVDRVLAIEHDAQGRLPLTAEALRALDVDTADVLGVGDWNGRPFLALDAPALLERLWRGGTVREDTGGGTRAETRSPPERG